MSFLQFAQSHGLLINPSRFDSSGRIKRCATESHPTSTNGAYMYDGGRGFVFRWDAEAKPIWFNDPNAKPWSDAEKKEFAQRQNQQREEQEKRYQQAEITAQAMLKSCTQAEHKHFEYKGLKGTLGLVTTDDNLFVPMRNVITDKLQGAQIISWSQETMSYDKKMLAGMRATDAVLQLGSRRAIQTILCEGYTTGLSIAESCRLVRLSALVVVCFSAGNLKRVAKHFPHAVIYADNDKSGTGQSAAKETGLRYCMSGVEGNDANDDHIQFGLMHVAGRIMDGLNSMN